MNVPRSIEKLAKSSVKKTLSTKRGTFLFVSYDLVGSTKLKINSPNWPIIFKRFYSIAEQRHEKDFYFWKINGDEILYFVPIFSQEKLVELIEAVYENTLTIHDSIKKDELSVKTTSWLGVVVDDDNGDGDILESGENLLISARDNTGSYDFLGPEIDAGFRITKFAHRQKLTLSAPLARIIVDFLEVYEAKIKSVKEENKYKYEFMDVNKIKIVGFEKLKGVWRDELYPIIWFHHDWEESFRLTFSYEELYGGNTIYPEDNKYRRRAVVDEENANKKPKSRARKQANPIDEILQYVNQHSNMVRMSKFIDNNDFKDDERFKI